MQVVSSLSGTRSQAMEEPKGRLPCVQCGEKIEEEAIRKGGLKFLRHLLSKVCF
jgi:hypothetical protein